jgi:hypothetical protein
MRSALATTHCLSRLVGFHRNSTSSRADGFSRRFRKVVGFVIPIYLAATG